MEFDKFLDDMKQKIASACQVPVVYITGKQKLDDLPLPHCQAGDLFYCGKEDNDYYGYYIYIIGDYPDLEGTGYEYYMVKDGIVFKSHGAPRHIDDSRADGLLVPIDDDITKAKILLLTNGI